MFHLDEYIGLPAPHPASFRKYLQERFITKLPGLTHYYLINGEVEAEKECERLGELISGTSGGCGLGRVLERMVTSHLMTLRQTLKRINHIF